MKNYICLLFFVCMWLSCPLMAELTQTILGSNSGEVTICNYDNATHTFSIVKSNGPNQHDLESQTCYKEIGLKFNTPYIIKKVDNPTPIQVTAPNRADLIVKYHVDGAHEAFASNPEQQPVDDHSRIGVKNEDSGKHTFMITPVKNPLSDVPVLSTDAKILKNVEMSIIDRALVVANKQYKVSLDDPSVVQITLNEENPSMMVCYNDQSDIKLSPANCPFK